MSSSLIEYQEEKKKASLSGSRELTWVDIAIWWPICHTAFPICGPRQSLVIETKSCFSNLTNSHRQRYTTSPQIATKDSDPCQKQPKLPFYSFPKLSWWWSIPRTGVLNLRNVVTL